MVTSIKRPPAYTAALSAPDPAAGHLPPSPPPETPGKKNLKNVKIQAHTIITANSISIEGEVAQSCPTRCDPVDCNLLGVSAHGILQARILEWIAIFFSMGSSQPRDQTRVSLIGGRRFNL